MEVYSDRISVRPGGAGTTAVLTRRRRQAPDPSGNQPLGRRRRSARRSSSATRCRWRRSSTRPEPSSTWPFSVSAAAITPRRFGTRSGVSTTTTKATPRSRQPARASRSGTVPRRAGLVSSRARRQATGPGSRARSGRGLIEAAGYSEILRYDGAVVERGARELIVPCALPRDVEVIRDVWRLKFLTRPSCSNFTGRVVRARSPWTPATAPCRARGSSRARRLPGRGTRRGSRPRTPGCRSCVA